MAKEILLSPFLYTFVARIMIMSTDKEDLLKRESDEEIIQREFNALLEDYKNSNHRQKIDIITKAFNFANAAHKGIRRRSGEPYILHPIAVARIVVKEIGLGSTSICSALLHDVVEDTDYTVEDIENLFGKKIAQIVDGLTKISGGVFGQQASLQAENFRKLLLTMSEDIRVILIKIADRLHNMRTLGSMPPAKQYKIAGETQYIYAPLAHRLGLFPIKTELENLSFKYEHPGTYADIERKLEKDKEARLEFYDQFSTPIKKRLEEMGYDFTLKARIKSEYSIWKKMSKRQIPFEEVYDILALRIIFTPKEDMSEKDQCWMIYSAITGIYRPHPERIRDWISTPKSNGYEALHVTVMGNNGKWVEVQIRTQRMDEIAEKGLAAHWKYKTGEQDDDSELDKWLKTIKDLLKNPEPDAIDFMDTFKLNLFASEIFVFTPKGEIKMLPQGATALDFAFMLHSDLGCRCLGAKVNHKLVPLSHVLEGGDQVEILSSARQNPQPEWLDFVTTAKAKSRLRAFFRKEERNAIILGEQMLNDELAKVGRQANVYEVNRLLSHYQITQPNDLFSKIAGKKLPLGEDIPKLFPKPKQDNFFIRYLKKPFVQSDTKTQETDTLPAKPDKKRTVMLSEKNMNTEYRLATCCQPIPGDDTLGYIDDANVVIVHKRQCPTALKLKTSFGERIVATQWNTHKTLAFQETIEVKGIDKLGVVIEVLHVISEQHSTNISEMHIAANAGIFTGRFMVYVHDTDEIQELCESILKIREVNSAIRYIDSSNNKK